MHLTEFKLLLEEQSGVWENRSCGTVLHKLTDLFLSNIDQDNIGGMVLVDLRKAFDLVNHDLILLKLDLYGCHGNELAWCVVRPSTGNNWCATTAQGSIFGPLALRFIILMNDAILEISVTRIDMS